jgi:hypothetical protein
VVSGAIASGAIASGAIASGAIVSSAMVSRMVELIEHGELTGAAAGGPTLRMRIAKSWIMRLTPLVWYTASRVPLA